MNKFFLSMILSLVLATSFGQQKIYRFLIEFINSGNETVVAPFFQITFNGTLLKTDGQGYIDFVRETGTSKVKLTLTDPKYIIAGPADIGFPEDFHNETTILIHRKTDKEQASVELIRRLQAVNLNVEQVKSADIQLNQQLKKMTDSILALVTSQYRVSEKDLRDAAEILSGKDQYFSKISFSLEGYLNEVKDVRDVFKNMLEFYLENPKSFRLLDSTRNVYNSFYQELNFNNNGYEKAVETYWQSPELGLTWHNTYDYAINIIHKTFIIPLNSSVVKTSNEYIHESNRRKRKELKEQITASLNNIIPLLDNSLVVLETKIKYLIARLEYQKDILN